METQKKQHVLDRQEKWIYMNKSEINSLFKHYFLLLIISFILFIVALLMNYVIRENSFPDIVGIVCFSITSGLMGSSIYYIRKFYKSCIQMLINDPEDSFSANVRGLGAKVYFYSRPYISAILAVIINLAFYGGFYVLQSQPSIDNDKYYIFCTLIAFYVGFCNGRIIVDLDSNGGKVLNFLVRGKVK